MVSIYKQIGRNPVNLVNLVNRVMIRAEVPERPHLSIRAEKMPLGAGTFPARFSSACERTAQPSSPPDLPFEGEVWPHIP